MFEYVKLRNFKSLVDVDLNLVDKKGNPKQLILIYGRNGIGKSNLASAFFMLSETFSTMNVRDLIQSIFLKDSESFENEDFKDFLRKNYKDMETLISDNKTIASKEPMYLEFGFNIDGQHGRYILETNETQLIHERLEYTLNKNRGLYFDISQHTEGVDIKINPRVFKDHIAYRSITHSCEKFWGKHSLISILFHESDDKAEQYIKQQLASNFEDVMEFLSGVSCKLKLGNKRERGVMGLPKEIIKSFEEGEIPLSKEERLNKTETMLNTFFKSIYKDIERVYYRRNIKDDVIHYKLIFNKIIANKEREISFDLESTGTQCLLDMLPFMLVVADGSVAFIDEYDMGIHDLLIENTLSSLFKSIKGQLILTTHNTLLMDSDIPKENIYIIKESNLGQKSITPITYNNKIHKNANVRNQYLHGSYSGVPDTNAINFNILYDILK